MLTLPPASDPKYGAALTEFIDYARDINLGPGSVKYSAIALVHIIDKGLCSSPEECVSYATALGESLHFINLIEKHIDPANFALEVNIPNLYELVAQSGKTYFDYLGKNAVKQEISYLRNFTESKILDSPEGLINAIKKSSRHPFKQNIANILSSSLDEIKAQKYVSALNVLAEKKPTIPDEEIGIKIRTAFGIPREEVYILSAGDSITHGNFGFVQELFQKHIEAGAEKSNFIGSLDTYITYPRYLENLINKYFHNAACMENAESGEILVPVFPNTTVLNSGVFGAISSEVKESMMHYMDTTNMLPLCAVILCGINDFGVMGLGGNIDEDCVYSHILSNIDEMVHFSFNKEVLPFVCTLTPTSDLSHNKKHVVRVNQLIKEREAEWKENIFDEISVIDTYSSLTVSSDEPHALGSTYDAGDGIHLSETGNKVLAKAIFEGIQPYLQKVYISLELDEEYRRARLDNFLHNHRPKKPHSTLTSIEIRTPNHKG